MHLVCNVSISTILLSVIYIGLSVVSSLAFQLKVATKHGDYAVGALCLCDWGIASRFRAFRQWDIPFV